MECHSVMATNCVPFRAATFFTRVVSLSCEPRATRNARLAGATCLPRFSPSKVRVPSSSENQDTIRFQNNGKSWNLRKREEWRPDDVVTENLNCADFLFNQPTQATKFTRLWNRSSEMSSTITSNSATWQIPTTCFGQPPRRDAPCATAPRSSARLIDAVTSK